MSLPTPPAGLSPEESLVYQAGFRAALDHLGVPPPEAEDPEVPLEPRYPHVEVRLSELDGNSFVMVSHVRMALKRAGVPEEECVAFFDEALSGDYDHVLQTIMRTVQTS